MIFINHKFFSWFSRITYYAFLLYLILCPGTSFAAATDLIDGLNLSPFVPMILDAFMAVATGGYDFFVGNGTGIIYVLVWAFLILSISLYLLKMYFPSDWLSFFGFSGGGDFYKGAVNPMDIGKNLLNPIIRAIIAATILLQIKPVYLTEFLINPFLQFGALYTEGITSSIQQTGINPPDMSCPPAIIEQGWLSKSSCEFLIQPISDLSNANNQIIKKGFEFLNSGLRGMMTLIPHGGENFLNVLTGILLIATFVSSNVFMALLIIQGIFNFGMALILYPFQVLTWVIKPRSQEKWFDIWPAFAGITKALQQLVITMIACAFILCVNIAIVKSLFNWNSSIFVVSAGGTATTNVPQISNTALGFGQHSLLWLSSILTFYLMFKIFEKTKEQLNAYVGSDMDNIYNKTTKDTKTLINKIQGAYKAYKNIKK